MKTKKTNKVITAPVATTSHSRWVGDVKCVGQLNNQKLITELDALMDLVVAEQAIKQITDGVRDGRLAAEVPPVVRKRFLKQYAGAA